MKTFNHILFFSSLLFFASCEESNTADEENEGGEELAINDQPVSDCHTAPASWFTTVDNQRVTPAPNEGPTSVFANSTTVENCDFHRWSWQKFLWLTNETNGKPFFLETMNQVGSDGSLISKGGGMLVLKGDDQASGAHDILKTPVSPSSTVYYSIMANDELYAAIEIYGAIAHDNPQDIVDLTFPVGALEMKTSWLDATALGADSSTYYITDALIGDNITTTRVALLGIHVVGIVENHPEFIWATFEHENLAPAYDWAAATPTTDAPVTSGDPAKAYPLFGKNATADVTNITSDNGIFTDIFSLYKYGVPVIKVLEGENGDRDIQDFMATSQNASQNFNNIRELNASVKEQLIEVEKSNSDVWQHYFYNGSIWIDMENYNTTEEQANLLTSLDKTLHDVSPGKLPRGSVSVYNITMETYVQAGFQPTSIHEINVNDVVNCFSCHGTHFKGSTVNSPLQISHLFNGYVSTLNDLTPAQIKEHHVATFRANAILKKIKTEE